MQSVHARLHVVAFIGRVVEAAVRGHPHVHRAVGAREELDVVHVRVGVAIRCELAGPGNPVAIERPVRTAVFRAPHANARSELPIGVGWAHVEGQVVVVLPAIARAVFAPAQDVRVRAGFPRTAGAVAAAHEFKRFACVVALVHAVQPAAIGRRACGEYHHSIGVCRRYRQLAPALPVIDAHTGPARCARSEGHTAVGGTLEHRAFAEQLDSVAYGRVRWVKGQFHVLTGGHLDHGLAVVFTAEQAVVGGGKQLGLLPFHDRCKDDVPVPPVGTLERGVAALLPREAAVGCAPELA